MRSGRDTRGLGRMRAGSRKARASLRKARADPEKIGPEVGHGPQPQLPEAGGRVRRRVTHSASDKTRRHIQAKHRMPDLPHYRKNYHAVTAPAVNATERAEGVPHPPTALAVDDPVRGSKLPIQPGRRRKIPYQCRAKNCVATAGFPFIVTTATSRSRSTSNPDSSSRSHAR